MRNNKKIERSELLTLLKNKPNETFEFQGYLKFNKESDWYTFTQLTLDGKLISKHINLPKHKVDKAISITKDDDHKPFLIKGKPISYQSKGTTRGAIEFYSAQRL